MPPLSALARDEASVASPPEAPGRAGTDTAIALVLVFAACALLTFCAVFVARHHALVGRLHHAASLAHHERMSAPRAGEAVFYVWHDEPERLARFAAREPGVLDASPPGLGNVASVTFAAADAPAIRRLREEPGVTLMVNRDTALLCR